MNVMRRWLALAGFVAVLAACSKPGADVAPVKGQAGKPATLQAVRATEAVVAGGVEDAAWIINASDPSASRIVGAAGPGGLEIYGLDGKRLGAVPAGETASVDVLQDVQLAGATTTLLAAIDSQGHKLRLFRPDGDTLAEVGARELPLGFAAEGVCLLKSRLDGSLHAFVVGDGGEIDHHLLFATENGKVDARQVRRFGVPSTLKRCVADPVNTTVYASEEAVGIWRFSADPEADLAAQLVDSPRNGILEEVGGLAIHDGGPGARWLLASDESSGHVNVYDIERDEAFVGSLVVASPGGEAIEEPGSISVASVALGSDFPSGALLVTDESGPDFKLASIAQLATALGLSPGVPQSAEAAPKPTVATVVASVETVPVGSFGDAADDPAIWAHPGQPEKSLIIATDKKAGLYVHDMQGRVKHFAADGKMNNVDLREGFRLDGKDIVLVAASDRTHQAIALYQLDTASGALTSVADGLQSTGMHDPYGLCMYRNAHSGEVYVFINGDDTLMRQWRLVDAGNGRVKAEPVRDLAFDSQTEGCVADDETGFVYVGEEDLALWKLRAAPDGGDEKVAVDRVDANPAIKDDLEGMGLYDLGDGRGYLVVSSQGNDTYAVYRREGKQEYLGSFAVVADPVRGIDGISETDGLEVTSRNLGPGFEHGAMVAQDGRNVLPAENQNFKMVPWKSIAEALGLEMRQP